MYEEDYLCWKDYELANQKEEKVYRKFLADTKALPLEKLAFMTLEDMLYYIWDNYQIKIMRNDDKNSDNYNDIVSIQIINNKEYQQKLKEIGSLIEL